MRPEPPSPGWRYVWAEFMPKNTNPEYDEGLSVKARAGFSQSWEPGTTSCVPVWEDEMEAIIQEIIRKEELFFVLVIAGSITIVSIFKALTGMVGRLAHERTRREVAAYIAEGSMTPEQGERLLASGKRNNGINMCG